MYVIHKFCKWTENGEQEVKVLALSISWETVYGLCSAAQEKSR